MNNWRFLRETSFWCRPARCALRVTALQEAWHVTLLWHGSRTIGHLQLSIDTHIVSPPPSCPTARTSFNHACMEKAPSPISMNITSYCEMWLFQDDASSSGTDMSICRSEALFSSYKDAPGPGTAESLIQVSWWSDIILLNTFILPPKPWVTLFDVSFKDTDPTRNNNYPSL